MRLSDPGRTCDLGSPVRETCTPGSEWGDGYKESCRLGEATASKGAASARLRKGYRSEACPYQPTHAAESRITIWSAVRASMIAFLLPRTLVVMGLLVPVLGWRIAAAHALLVTVVVILFIEIIALA